MSLISLHIHIDYNCGIPICSQVVAQIKLLVVGGRLKIGDKLPSIRELAKKLRVNPTTVARIYTELEHEGVITLRQGQGAFISKQEPQLLPDEIQRQIGQHAQTLLVEGLRLGLDISAIKELLDREYQTIQMGTNEEKTT